MLFRRPIWLVILMIILCWPAVQTTAGAGDAVEESGEEAGMTPRLELDEIVVTAAKMEEPVRQVPRNITVITSEDIAQAPSNNIVDLLNREVGVNLRSLAGGDKQAVVDIRGMGAAAASNVVVMVDGVRMNAPDMSGFDFSTIPLEMVDRIEVIRGGGSVMYGDGSVGGVINIVTRKGTPDMERRLYASYGSYETLDTRAGVSGSVKDLGYHINAVYYDSDGYRENGGLLKQDLSAVLDYFLSDAISLNLSGIYHEDAYGLPGPVEKQDIDSRHDRTGTDYPEDEGTTSDRRLSGGFEVETDNWGVFKLTRGYRWRNNDFVVGYTPLLDRDDQSNEIEAFTKTLNVLYEKNLSVFDREHRLQVGLDHFYTDYVREEAPGGPRQNNRMASLGAFVNNRWSLGDRLKLQWGGRLHQTRGRFRTDQLVTFGDEQRWVNGETEDLDWWNTAYDLGASYTLSDGVMVYGSYATHFRTPNVDELAESEAGLNPQKGYQLEAGGRFEVGGRLALAATVFHIAIEDEIYYSEINRNYDDRTIREGVESEIKWTPVEELFIWGNYSYTTARFEDSGATVPLVPKHKGSMGIEWLPVPEWTVSLTGTFVGPRFDGNDVENDRYDKLDAYQVYDTKVTYSKQSFKGFVGVNNILDAWYETASFSERYYPMPGRNAYAGIQMRF